MIFLGIDLGTSGVKILAIDENQTELAAATCSLSIEHPHEGWSEQSPDAWVAATETAMDEIAQALGTRCHDIGAIGLSGQMHGATLLDKHDRPLRPCLLWNDTRASAEAAAFDANPAFQNITGNIVFPGFTAPKVEWVRRHEPSIFEQTRRILLPKDYLRLWLTGTHMSDMSDAAGTAWLDTGARDWSDGLLEHCNLTRDHMPELVEGTAPTGVVRVPLAERWGMRHDVLVAGGAGDNAATAVGLGTTNDGAGFVSLGTSGVLFAAGNAYRPDPATAVHSFCHALPDTWHQMGVILSAASTLTWFSNICGASPRDLVAELGDALRAPGRVQFHPYLSGERTPHNDPALRGSFSGLSHATSRADLTQAIIEGVTFALYDNLVALRRTGTEFGSLTASGGGANAIYWLKAIATSFGVAVDLPKHADLGAALGAARLGMIAAGAGTIDDICTKPEFGNRFEPSTDLSTAYQDAHERFASNSAN